MAFHEGPSPPLQIVKGTRWREWMNETFERFANRCLPLLMANEAGWLILNPAPFKATWDGGTGTGSLLVEYPEDTPPELRAAHSHFGHGIVTWHTSYTFRTPPDYNLLVRGPANWPKADVAALEGLVETDWSAAPFTMNWKLMRPDVPVVFEKDEPFCQIVPQRRGELESFAPEFRTLDDDPETRARSTASRQPG